MPNPTLRLLASCSALLSLSLCTSVAAQDSVRLEPSVPAPSPDEVVRFGLDGERAVDVVAPTENPTPASTGEPVVAGQPRNHHDPHAPGATGAPEANASVGAGSAALEQGAVEPSSGLAYSTRGLVLPAGRLRVDAFARDPALLGSGFMFGEDGSQSGLRISRTHDYIAVGLGLGVSYGVTDALELGIDALPLYFTGNITIGSFNSVPLRSGGLGGIPLYARYVFHKTDVVQIGGQFALRLLDWGFQVGLPVSMRLGQRLRVETGVAFEATQYGRGTTVEYGIVLPVAVSLDLSDRFHIGARLALSYRPNTSSFAGGVFGGYVLDLGGGLSLDLQARASVRMLKPLNSPSPEIVLGAALWFDTH